MVGESNLRTTFPALDASLLLRLELQFYFLCIAPIRAGRPLFLGQMTIRLTNRGPRCPGFGISAGKGEVFMRFSSRLWCENGDVRWFACAI